jgi:hypothetical protein
VILRRRVDEIRKLRDYHSIVILRTTIRGHRELNLRQIPIEIILV